MEHLPTYVMYMIASPPESAEALAKALVEERAAACGQVTAPATSFFYWEGKLHRETEALIFLKTARSKREAVQRVLTAHHPYQVPELIELPLTGGNEAYFRWIDSVLSDAEGPFPSRYSFLSPASAGEAPLARYGKTSGAVEQTSFFQTYLQIIRNTW